MPTRRVWILIVLAAVPIALYGRMLSHDFVIWDDPLHVTENPTLNPVTPEGLARVWQGPYFSLYMPLTYTLWATEAVADRAIRGVGPTAPLDATLFKAVSIVMFTASVLLVFCIVQTLLRNDWAAATGAMLFAVHPLQVEAVAWISDNKGLLSTALGLCALWMHLQDDAKREAPAEGDGATASHHFTATVFYILALLAKPTAVILPVMAGLIDVVFRGQGIWPTARRLIDWVAIAGVWVLVTRWSQTSEYLTYITPLHLRPLVAIDAIGFYFQKLLWPGELIPDYGRTPERVLDAGAIGWHWLLPAVALLFIGVRRRGAIAAGLAVMMAALLPVIGLMPFHFQEISNVADRYMYLPMLGVAIAAGGLVAAFPKRWTVPVWLVIFLALAARTWQQIDVWRDSPALLTYVLEHNPQSHSSHNNYAVWLRQEDRLDEAIEHFQQAAELNPDIAEPHIGLGDVYLARREYEQAEAALRKAITFEPPSAYAHLLLGKTLEAQGRLDEAFAEYERSLEIEPGQPRIARRLAWRYATHPDPQIRNAAMAVQLATAAIQMTQTAGYRMYDTLAAAYAAAGRFEQAVAEAQKALALAQQLGNQVAIDEVEQHLDYFRHGQSLTVRVEGAEAQDQRADD